MKEDKSLENKAERVFIVFQLLLDILEQDLFVSININILMFVFLYKFLF